jgi:hypothetical protein
MMDELVVRIEIGEIVEDNESVVEGNPCQEQNLCSARDHSAFVPVANVLKYAVSPSSIVSRRPMAMNGSQIVAELRDSIRPVNMSL